jgi:hypothetical protein
MDAEPDKQDSVLLRLLPPHGSGMAGMEIVTPPIILKVTHQKKQKTATPMQNPRSGG